MIGRYDMFVALALDRACIMVPLTTTFDYDDEARYTVILHRSWPQTYQINVIYRHWMYRILRTTEAYTGISRFYYFRR